MNLEKFDGLNTAKNQISQMVKSAFTAACEKGRLTANGDIKDFTVEVPRDLKNGDFSTNVAMVNAKVFGTNPRAIAAALVENMSFDGTFFDRAEIAGPGFMNFFLNNSYFETVVKAVLERNPCEWGFFYIQRAGQKWYEAQVKIEYQYGNLKSTVPEKIARKKIKRVHSNGGWSLMDYWIET